MIRTFTQARPAALLVSAVCCLAFAAPASAATFTENPDAGEDTTGALDATLEDLTRIEGIHGDPDDVDLYKVVVKKSCDATIRTFSSFDPSLSLFDGNGNRIAFALDDDTSADGNDQNEARIEQMLTAGATYYVGISIHGRNSTSSADVWVGSGNPNHEYPTDYAIEFEGDCFNGDADNDGDLDGADNCPTVANSDQTDSDGDSEGDACDADDDGDDDLDGNDNCPLAANPDQADNDGDGEGDVCDSDDDNDGVGDVGDNCEFVANNDQANNDGDSRGDACDLDDDNDNALDSVDNCALLANDQLDTDVDGRGDACDADDDGDSVVDSADNCPLVPNDQRDSDGDGKGDACDGQFDSTAGKATGGGTIVWGGSNVALSVSAKNEAGGPLGTCQVVVGKTKIKCLDVDGYWQSPSGDRVVLVGDALVNGDSTHYRIELEDHGEPGSTDMFSIETDPGPDAGGVLRGGNVQIHRP